MESSGRGGVEQIHRGPNGRGESAARNQSVPGTGAEGIRATLRVFRERHGLAAEARGDARSGDKGSRGYDDAAGRFGSGAASGTGVPGGGRWGRRDPIAG